MVTLCSSQPPQAVGPDHGQPHKALSSPHKSVLNKCLVFLSAVPVTNTFPTLVPEYRPFSPCGNHADNICGPSLSNGKVECHLARDFTYSGSTVHGKLLVFLWRRLCWAFLGAATNRGSGSLASRQRPTGICVDGTGILPTVGYICSCCDLFSHHSCWDNRLQIHPIRRWPLMV